MAVFVKAPYLAQLLFVSLVLAQGNIEITFTPTEPPKVGEEVKIKCSADEQILDILQIVKVIDEIDYGVSTNDFLKEPFQATNRYTILLTTENSRKTVEITVKDVQGVDSGKYECRHTLLNGTKHVTDGQLDVLVPPSSVEIMQFKQGDISEVEEGKAVLLKEGEEHGLICRVTVEGSLADPDVSITIGEEDATEMFEFEAVPSTDTNGGLVEMQNILTFTYKTEMPNTENNGQTLTCGASLPQFEAISDSVEIEVHTFPTLECENVEGMLGDNVELSCQAIMFPALELASASWTRGVEQFFLDLDEPDLDRHHFSVKDNDDGTSDIVITLDEIMEEDFGSYKIEVQNAHGPGTFDVILDEVKPTTTSTTIPATTPEPKDEDLDSEEVPEPGSSAGSAICTMAPVSLIWFLTLALSSWL